jgi:hypothetical protein
MKSSAARAVAAVLIVVAIILRALILRGAGAVGGAASGAPAPRPPREIRWDGPRGPGGGAACYPPEMVAACQQLVRGMIRESRRFGPATAEERERLDVEAARLSREHGVAPFGGDRLLAMRNMEVALEAQTGGVRALRHGPEMLAASRRGEPVTAIAERLRLPPMAVLRQILFELGHSVAAVRAMIADPDARMPAQLAREAPAIFEADLGSRLNAGRIQERSRAYEDALGAHLRGLGLRFRTEGDLRRAAPAGDPPRLTPDFLLDGPARIDGRPVHWIDAKDYPMYGSRLVAKSLASQAKKYATAFGPGAMVFSGGLMCDARVLPAGAQPLLLDGSHVVKAA